MCVANNNGTIDFSPYTELLLDKYYSKNDYFESSTEVSFKKRKSTAEGTLRLKFLVSANEKGELFFIIEGPGIEYTGNDSKVAIEKFETAKLLFDNN